MAKRIQIRAYIIRHPRSRVASTVAGAWPWRLDLDVTRLHTTPKCFMICKCAMRAQRWSRFSAFPLGRHWFLSIHLLLRPSMIGQRLCFLGHVKVTALRATALRSWQGKDLPCLNAFTAFTAARWTWSPPLREVFVWAGVHLRRGLSHSGHHLLPRSGWKERDGDERRSEVQMKVMSCIFAFLMKNHCSEACVRSEWRW